jgi:hypothetical protein
MLMLKLVTMTPMCCVCAKTVTFVRYAYVMIFRGNKQAAMHVFFTMRDPVCRRKTCSFDDILVISVLALCSVGGETSAQMHIFLNTIVEVLVWNLAMIPSV